MSLRGSSFNPNQKNLMSYSSKLRPDLKSDSVCDRLHILKALCVDKGETGSLLSVSGFFSSQFQNIPQLSLRKCTDVDVEMLTTVAEQHRVEGNSQTSLTVKLRSDCDDVVL